MAAPRDIPPAIICFTQGVSTISPWTNFGWFSPERDLAGKKLNVQRLVAYFVEARNIEMNMSKRRGCNLPLPAFWFILRILSKTELSFISSSNFSIVENTNHYLIICLKWWNRIRPFERGPFVEHGQKCKAVILEFLYSN